MTSVSSIFDIKNQDDTSQIKVECNSDGVCKTKQGLKAEPETTGSPGTGMPPPPPPPEGGKKSRRRRKTINKATKKRKYRKYKKYRKHRKSSKKRR